MKYQCVEKNCVSNISEQAASNRVMLWYNKTNKMGNQSKFLEIEPVVLDYPYRVQYHW